MSSATADERAFTVRQRLFVFAAVLVAVFVLVLVLGFVL